MKVYQEISMENFEAWSGGQNTLDRIIKEGKTDILEDILEDLYPDGIDETALNDILRFESDWVYEVCGIRSESEIREELEEAKEELAELMETFEYQCKDMIEFENASRMDEELYEMDEEEIESLKSEIWANDYEDNAEEIKEKIAELEEELENI